MGKLPVEVKRRLVEEGVVLPHEFAPDSLRTDGVHDHGLMGVRSGMMMMMLVETMRLLRSRSRVCSVVAVVIHDLGVRQLFYRERLSIKFPFTRRRPTKDQHISERNKEPLSSSGESSRATRHRSAC